jgi:hypothetical protein
MDKMSLLIYFCVHFAATMVCCLLDLFFWLLSQHAISALKHLHDMLEMIEGVTLAFKH